MSYVKQFRLSASLRTKGYDLLSRYEPSDLVYTLGGAVYDRMNKMQISGVQAHSKEAAREMKKKKDYYFKAAKRLVAAARSLKMLEMQYL